MSCIECQMDMMMETGEDMENETYEQTAIATALKASGEKVSASFHRKTKSLKVSRTSGEVWVSNMNVCVLDQVGLAIYIAE